MFKNWRLKFLRFKIVMSLSAHQRKALAHIESASFCIQESERWSTLMYADLEKLRAIDEVLNV